MVRRISAALYVVCALALWSPSIAAEDARSQLDAARELYASGDWETAKEAYEAAYQASAENSVMKAEAALEWSSVLWEQGDYRAAEVRVKDALSRAKALKLDHAIGRLMLTQGHIEASLGKLSSAETTLKICAKLARDQKDINFAALCRINLRFVSQLRGRPGPSQTQYQKDLNTLKKSGNELLVGTALAKTAESYSRSGDHVSALQLLEQAQAQFTKANSVPAQSRNRLRRAQVYQEMNRWDDAAKDLSGLVLRFKNMRNRPSLVTTYALNARQAEHAGDASKAQKLYQSSLKTAKSLGSPQLIGNAHLSLCEHFVRQTNAKAGMPECQKAIKVFDKAGIPDLALRGRIAVARMSQVSGDLRGARTAYVEIVQAMTKSKRPTERRTLAVQQTNLCQVELQLKTSGARTRCKAALKSINAVGPANDDELKAMAASTHYAVGVLAYQDNVAKEANKHLVAAADLYDALQQNGRAAETYLRLGRLQLRSKQVDAAVTSFTTALTRAGQTPGTLETRVQVRIQYAQALMEQSKWAEAKKELQTLDAEATQRSDAYSRAWGKSALARVELKLGQKDSAIRALEDGIKLAKKAGDKELEKSMRSNLEKFK